MYAISGGSFHSGQILLDGDVSPRVGTEISFAVRYNYHNGVDGASPLCPDSLKIAARFVCVPPPSEGEAEPWRFLPTNPVDKEIVEKPTFIAASESGFTLHEGEEGGDSWVCSIPFIHGVSAIEV